MEITLEQVNDLVMVVRLTGRLDLLHSARLKQEVSELVDTGKSLFVLDLADVTFIDSSGLGAMISSLKAARRSGGNLCIARPSEQALTLLRLTTLDRVLHPYSSVEESIESFSLANH